jgi:hypothetical protein
MNRTVQAEDLKVDHRWNADHQGVILAAVQGPGLSVKNVRHKSLGVSR